MENMLGSMVLLWRTVEGLVDQLAQDVVHRNVE